MSKTSLPEDKSALLNSEQTAEYLGLSVSYIRKSVTSAAGHFIPHVRIGACVRFRRKDLDTWIEEQVKGK